ncbi:MAG: CoA-binding protein [Rhodobacteraceae bacterium]|nr:CoA-binding protein [Paracoccaceae bacterium]
MQATDAQIRQILKQVQTIACVGFSHKSERPSHSVSGFLVAQGYTVIPVNPGLEGRRFLGQTVRARLADLTRPVDMIDVFRRPEALPALVDEVLAMAVRPKVLWTQLGVVHPGALQRARAAGMDVVADRCPAIEIPRLFPGGLPGAA